MKEVRFSIYELGMLERYLSDFIELKKIAWEHRSNKNDRFNSIEYDEKMIEKLLERVRGKNYEPDYIVQTTVYDDRNYSGDEEDK